MTLSDETVDTKPTRMSGRTEAVARPTTGLGGIGGFLFGLVFVAVGTCIALVGLKVIPVDDSTVHAPYWVLTAVGGVFAFGGFMVWVMTARAYVHGIRCKVSRASHPDEPAFGDYPWNPKGMKKGPWKRVLQSLLSALFMGVFLSPFNWWAWVSDDKSLFVRAIVTLFDVFLIAVVGQFIHRFIAAVRFGPSKIEYRECPYRPGSEVVVPWFAPNGISDSGTLTFTLRCVQEWTQTSGSGKNRSSHQVNKQLWASVRTTEGRLSVSPGRPLDLSFSVPENSLGTRISTSGKATFWELEVKADVPGVDFNERYLVPIYQASPSLR